MTLHLEQAGLAAKAAGRFDEAARLFREQARLEPKSAGPLYNLGNTLIAAGRPAEAIEPYRRAVRLLPNFAGAHNNLGLAQLAVGELGHAANSFARAAALEPANPGPQHLAGHALLQLGRTAEALAYLQRADALAPGQAVIITDLADALYRLGETQAVLPYARQAAALAPDRVEVWNNLANAERALANMAEAEAASRRALALDPDNADASYNLGLTLLAAGRLHEAWPYWESRFESVMRGPWDLPGPRWTGASLAGGTVLVRCEQGLGDTIQFCRYAALAAARARIVLAVQSPLVGLLQGLPGAAAVVDAAAPLPAYDAQAPLLSLPGLLGTSGANIPAAIPYLAADPALRSGWRARLAALPGLRVGLVWAGNPGFPFDHLRSIPAAMLAPLGRVAGASFVSLQLAAKDRPGFDTLDAAPFLTDFAQSAALLAELDLVIGVDTAVIHLAGALGRPVWLANRHAGDWRWGMDGTDSVWYPTLRQFRQGPGRDWRPVMATMADSLAALVAAAPRPAG